MVTVSKESTTANAAGVANPAGRLAAKLTGGLVLWLRGVFTRRALMRLDDRALADIGTTRDELRGFAKQSDAWRQLPWDAVTVLAYNTLVERLESWSSHRRQQARTYRELMAYSDQELTDLGIRRRDIAAIARGDGRPSPA